jgi:hypothetical protein
VGKVWTSIWRDRGEETAGRERMATLVRDQGEEEEQKDDKGEHGLQSGRPSQLYMR